MKTNALLAGLSATFCCLIVSAHSLSSPKAPQSAWGASAIASSSPATASPHPRDIFCLTERDLPPGVLNNGGSYYQGGETVTIYTVPADKWLVITDVRLSWGTGWELQEILGPVKFKRRLIDARFTTPVPYPLGFTFAPGSMVAFKKFGGSAGDAIGEFALIG